jgi:hypothetical protein
MKNQKITKENYNDCTYGEFYYKTALPAKLNEMKPDFKDKKGDYYWYTNEGVYRLSNHWTSAGSCVWLLKGQTNLEFYEHYENEKYDKLGFCFWDDFKKIKWIYELKDSSRITDESKICLVKQTKQIKLIYSEIIDREKLYDVMLNWKMDLLEDENGQQYLETNCNLQLEHYCDAFIFKK